MLSRKPAKALRLLQGLSLPGGAATEAIPRATAALTTPQTAETPVPFKRLI